MCTQVQENIVTSAFSAIGQDVQISQVQAKRPSSRPRPRPRPVSRPKSTPKNTTPKKYTAPKPVQKSVPKSDPKTFIKKTPPKSTPPVIAPTKKGIEGTKSTPPVVNDKVKGKDTKNNTIIQTPSNNNVIKNNTGTTDTPVDNKGKQDKKVPIIAPTQSGTGTQNKSTPSKSVTTDPIKPVKGNIGNPSGIPNNSTPPIIQRTNGGTGTQVKSTPRKVKRTEVPTTTTVIKKSNPTRVVEQRTVYREPVIINNRRYRTYTVNEPMYFDDYGYEVPIGSTIYSRPYRSWNRPFYSWGTPVYYVNTGQRTQPVTRTGSILGMIVNLILLVIVCWLFYLLIRAIVRSV